MAEQPSLFSAHANTDALQVVEISADFADWQRAARELIGNKVEPASVWWQASSPTTTVFIPTRPTTSPQSSAVSVPRRFVDQARAAACHRADDRWAVMYEGLWRLTCGAEPHLLSLADDRVVRKLHQYSKAVQRDAHKMKAFVRFRHVPDPASADGRYIAWVEPEQFTLAYVAGFFQRRFASMRWSIMTPDRCAHWDGPASGGVWLSPGVDRSSLPDHDAFEDLWRTYYRSIFNPARLKIQAMQSEMPQKYWKNLPEAELIPALIKHANQRVFTMREQTPRGETLHCGPLPLSPQAQHLQRLSAAPIGSLRTEALRAATCQNCELGACATQTVFGEGPENARILVIGEQPGAEEDLAGRPFVGPAGKLLDQALIAAGLVRSELYVTNAVKHFRFVIRGKHRLHAKPKQIHIDACSPWLAREIASVAPGLIIALGETAVRSQLGAKARITSLRGQIVQHTGTPILATWHPAYLLRSEQTTPGSRLFDQWVSDLRLASQWSGRA